MQPPGTSPRDSYWEKVHLESTIAILTSVKEAARQLVPITAALQTLYVAAVLASGVKEDFEDTWLLAFLALPVLAWLACLGLSISLVVPESWELGARPTPSEVEKVYRATAGRKLRRLRLAQNLLLASLALLAFDFMLYLWW